MENGKRIVLIDSNHELINCYLNIKEDVEKLINILNTPKFINDKDVYYEVRAEELTDKFEKAARTIYLNKTCFNGLYRVNRKGKFNVPFGRYKNPMICNPDNLRSVSLALRNVEVVCGGFENCLEFAERDDFVYFDPPYQPLSRTSSFTSYTKDSFSEEDQNKLCQIFRELDERGCKIILSNSDTPLIRELYKDFRVDVAIAKRAINCKAAGRGPINELIILNY